MSPPTSPIIILPNGDALRADTITAVVCASGPSGDGSHHVRVITGDTSVSLGSSSMRDHAEAARDTVIKQWRAATEWQADTKRGEISDRVSLMSTTLAAKLGLPPTTPWDTLLAAVPGGGS